MIRALALALSLVISSSAVLAEEVVHVYNWSDYIAPGTLEQFEQQTGIRVVYDVFDSNELLETKLLAGSAGYDVVVPTGSFLSRQIQAGVFMPLDHDKLPNRVNEWDLVRERTAQFDPDNAYSVNYMWGTTGLGLNQALLLERLPEAPLDSWALLFDPDVARHFADCGIHVLDASEEVLPAALAYIGEDPNTKDLDVIEKAQNVLESVRPYIRKFHSSEYINALANGEICLALGWSGDILQARDRAAEAGNGVDITYVIPQEGAQMWFDQMAIPADAPHPENAHTLINFLLDAQVAANQSNYIYYANGNYASKPLLEDEVRNDPGIYPSDEVMARLFTKDTFEPRLQRRVTRIWTAIKTGR